MAATHATAYTGVLMLLQAAIRHRTKLSVVQADLERMNAPGAFTKDFVAVLRRLYVFLAGRTLYFCPHTLSPPQSCDSGGSHSAAQHTFPCRGGLEVAH